jgi:hypothetical protein
MVCIGEDQTYTMAKTVGLPVAMATCLSWTGKLPRLECNFLFVRSVSTDIERIKEYGVVLKEQSMTYYGYKPDNTK